MLGAAGYNLYRSTSPGGEGGTPYQGDLTGSDFIDAETAATPYYYTVQAIYSGGAGTISSEVSAAAEVSAPTAPSGLTATANGSDEIDLSWAAGSGADDYVIERSTDGTNFSDYDQVDASQTTYQDTGVDDGTIYYYRVRASNAVGDSADSNSASASTPLAAPDELTATAASSSEIDLSWENNSATATGFTIERSTDGTTFNPIGTASGNATTFNDTGLSAGTSYTYQVVATLDSQSSAPSASASAITLPAPLAGLTATAASSSEIDLSWADVTGASGYEIDRQDASGNWEEIDAVDSPAASYADTGLSDGTSYTYQVIPYNDSGEAEGSNPNASATTSLIAPDNVVAVALSPTSVEIMWDNESAGATGFSVQRIVDDGEDGAPVSVAAGTTDYVDSSGIVAGDTYSFQVSATNGTGASPVAESNQVATPTPPPSDAAPQQPTLTATAVSDSEIDLSWAAPTDGSHLELEEQGPTDNNFAVITIPSPTTEEDGSTVYAITGLSPDASYSFQLRADLNGLASYSAVAQATTQSSMDDTSYPLAAPTIVSAWSTGGGPVPPAAYVTIGVDDSWDTSQYELSGAGEVVPAEDPYHVYDLDNVPDAILPSPGTATVGFDAEPGFTLQLRYAIYQDNVGLVSPYSQWQSVTVNGERIAPATGLTASAGNDNNVTLNWTASIGDSRGYPAAGYAIFGVTPAGTAVGVGYVDDGSTTTATVASSSNAGEYVKYFVIASGSGGDVGDSLYSNYADNPYNAAAPAAPSNLSATPFDDSSGSGIRLLWDDNSDNETGFTIQRSTSPDFTTVQTFTSGPDQPYYTDTTGTAGTQYYYRVEANGAGDPSGFSNTVPAEITLPTVSVTAIDPDATAEGPDGSPQDGYFDFHRSGNLTAALAANVSYDGSTAVAGTDYSGTLPTQVTFNAGVQDVIVAVAPATSTSHLFSTVVAAIEASENGSYASSTSPAQVNIAGTLATLVAYRTAGNYGQQVAASDVLSHNPSSYVILTDTNFTQDPSNASDDLDYNTALVNASKKVNVSNLNFAKITIAPLDNIDPAGDLQLQFSDAGDVRLYDSSGALINPSTCSLDLAHPSGPLAGLLDTEDENGPIYAGPVSIYVEGLSADPDFSIQEAYTAPDGTVSSQRLDMAILGVSYANVGKQTIAAVAPVNRDTVLAATDAAGLAETQTTIKTAKQSVDSSAFTTVLSGISANHVQQLKMGNQTIALSQSPGDSGVSVPEFAYDFFSVNPTTTIDGIIGVRSYAAVEIKTAKDDLFTVLPTEQAAKTADFFFDGTDNDGNVASKNTPPTDTNVYKMYQADTSADHADYEPGVVTNDGVLNPIGNVGGLGADARIGRAWNKLLQYINDGDTTIDIVGFSRGATEALAFANRIANKGIQATEIQKLNVDGMPVLSPPLNEDPIYLPPSNITMRFVGLYDRVSTFAGISGYDFDESAHVPASIGRLAHAVALSEHRASFPWTNLSGPNVVQVGFRGAHADIGGGYGPDGISQITLGWMTSQAALANWTIPLPPSITPPDYAPSQVHNSYSGTVLHLPVYKLLAPVVRSFPPGLLCWTPDGDLPQGTLIPFGSKPRWYWDPLLPQQTAEYTG